MDAYNRKDAPTSSAAPVTALKPAINAALETAVSFVNSNDDSDSSDDEAEKKRKKREKKEKKHKKQKHSQEWAIFRVFNQSSNLKRCVYDDISLCKKEFHEKLIAPTLAWIHVIFMQEINYLWLCW